MKRLFHRRLSKLTLLAFATSLFIVPAGLAMPIIDPGPPASPAQVVSAENQSLTDGWYPAALQQTRLNAAKEHAATWYRSPISNHGPVLP